MEPVVAIIILLITLIVVALAAFLIPVILELGKINRALAGVLGGVGEIATKTAPVNGVLDAINVTLTAGRNLLEGLALEEGRVGRRRTRRIVLPGRGPTLPRAHRTPRHSRPDRRGLPARRGDPRLIARRPCAAERRSSRRRVLRPRRSRRPSGRPPWGQRPHLTAQHKLGGRSPAERRRQTVRKGCAPLGVADR